jgi:hypothetical protein
MQLECAALVKLLTMDSKNQFFALEVMCCGCAVVARKEMEYWLSEAEEWVQLRKTKPQRPCLDQPHNKFERRTASTHLDLSDSRRRCRAREEGAMNFPVREYSAPARNCVSAVNNRRYYLEAEAEAASAVVSLLAGQSWPGSSLRTDIASSGRPMA